VKCAPWTSLHPSKIFATGDTRATNTGIMSGDNPVVLDDLDAAPTAGPGPPAACLGPACP
jgi:hypothetical protein